MKKRERVYSGTTSGEVSVRETENRIIARKAAAESMVLLKNDGILPLKKGARVALFGGGAVSTIKGGTGSGDVNEREVVSIYQGFSDAGLVLTNREWLEGFAQIYRKAREDWRDAIVTQMERSGSKSLINVYSQNIFRMPAGEPIRESDLADVEAAFYVISRTAGEDADRFAAEGDYYLTKQEQEQLRYLSEHCENIIVILNTGGQIDLQYIRDIPNLRALLYIGQPGMEGGHALADIVLGEVTPGGKLTDTWSLAYEDFPNSETFSHNNGNLGKEFYEEGIYTGYRYFDSFEKEVAYPFGYGLSYTDFQITAVAVTVGEDNQVRVSASVENTGNTYAGREVVQIYVSCPQGKLQKEYRRLAGFAKTGLLQPKETQSLDIILPAKNLAAYDEQQAAWILEKGLYGIWAGNSSRSVELVAVLSVDQEVVLEQVSSVCPLQEQLEELECPEVIRLQKEKEWHRLAEEKGLAVITFRPEEEKRKRLPQNKAAQMAAELTEKLTTEQLIAMVIGEISKGQGQVLGAAGIKVPGAAGETSGILEQEYDVPGVVMADGPAGLRLVKSYEVNREDGSIYDQGFLGALEGGFFAKQENHDNADRYYQYCTAIPVGSLLAQSWDEELLETVGRAVAREMQEFGIAWWLAPGMNIHRNPLCGRNFEYYSEDPLVSGKMAAAVTRGVQSAAGTGTTIKHFACNNQEDNRMGVDSILSERALREIYLRGFEIAVREAQPMAIMTSYNLINGVHTANSKDLCTQVAREEWDFQGIIMTDWTTTMPHGGSSPWRCIAAGNELIMPGCQGDVEGIRKALEDGSLDRDTLKACVRRLLTCIFQTLAYEDAVSYGEQYGCRMKER